MTDLERRSRQIDRDRRAVEFAAMMAMLPLLAAAADHAAQAIRIGTNPVTAASAVLTGTPALHQPGIADVFASAGTGGWLLGYHRSQAVAAERVAGRTVGMGTYQQAVRATPNILRPPAAQAPVIRRIVARAGGEQAVQRRYDGLLERARPVVRNIETRVAQRLQMITVRGPAAEYTPPPGAHLPDAIARAMDESRIAFERAGVGARTSWYIPDRHPKAGEPNVSANAEALVEAVVGEQYEAGRLAGARDADRYGVDGGMPTRTLWGWTWSSVVDGHRCRYCRKLHGTTAPLDDPLWEQFGPLLHFRCRCCRLERYQLPGREPPRTRRPDLTDADIVHAITMRRGITSWWQGLPLDPSETFSPR